MEVGNADNARLQGKDSSYNPFAFPPSMEVDAEVRTTQDAYRDIGGRVMQEQLSALRPRHYYVLCVNPNERYVCTSVLQPLAVIQAKIALSSLLYFIITG